MVNVDPKIQSINSAMMRSQNFIDKMEGKLSSSSGPIMGIEMKVKVNIATMLQQYCQNIYNRLDDHRKDTAK